MSKVAKKLLKGSLYVFLGTLLAQFFAYLTRIYLVKTLGQADYGLFAAIYTTIFFVLFFRDLGLQTSLTSFIAKFITQKRFGKLKAALVNTTIFQLAISILFVIGFWFLAPFLAEHYFKSEQALGMLRLFSLYIPLGIIIKFIPAFFRGFQSHKIYASFEPVKNISIFLLIMFFFYIGHTLYAPIYAYVAVNLVLLLIYIVPIFKTFNIFKYEAKEKLYNLQRNLHIWASTYWSTIFCKIHQLF